jgi:GDPmannose 4,6-dehydratase
MHSCNILDVNQVQNIFSQVMPDELYHLASNVDPNVIFEEELKTFQLNFNGAINFLRAVKKFKICCKVYFAGSSLMFGNVSESPQNEKTLMNPTTPYGIAKVATYQFIKMYRDAYGIFACMGILFNHESPRRDDRFLPKKISKAVARIKHGLQDKLILGDINISRDWSFAGDVVESMWLMLQAKQPRDYVIGSGKLHTIKEVLEIAFGQVDLDWKKFVLIDDKFIRKIEYENLCADASRVMTDLGWRPKKNFSELITEMVNVDMKIVGESCD